MRLRIDHWCLMMRLSQDWLLRCLLAQGAEAHLLGALAPAQPFNADRTGGAAASGPGAGARVRVAAATRLDVSVGPADAGSAAAGDTDPPLLLRGENAAHS